MPSGSARPTNSTSGVVQISSRAEFHEVLDDYGRWRQQFLDDHGELKPRFRPAPMVASFMARRPARRGARPSPCPRGRWKCGDILSVRGAERDVYSTASLTWAPFERSNISYLRDCISGTSPSSEAGSLEIEMRANQPSALLCRLVPVVANYLSATKIRIIAHPSWEF